MSTKLPGKNQGESCAMMLKDFVTMRKSFRPILALAGIAVFASTAAAFASDASKGLAKAAICASCHGPAGVSPVPNYPDIAGQKPLYIEYALRRYRAGERQGDQAGMMYTVTQALTDDDISDLAAYFAALRPGR